MEDSILKRKVKEKLDNIIDEIIQGVIKKEIAMDSMGGLYGGSFGILLFLLYSQHNYSNFPSNKSVNLYIIKVINSLSHFSGIYTYSSGLSGILYLLLFFKEKSIIDIDYSTSEKIFDDFILQKMRDDIKESNYDFLHGVIGAGLYFNKKGNIYAINQLINYLEQTADKNLTSHAYRWESIIDYQKKEKGYNISLSHGCSSIALFLSRIISQQKNNIDNKKCIDLLKGCVKFILSQKFEDSDKLSIFPSICLSESAASSRLAWCYGDLGIGYAIYYAGKTILNDDWTRRGIDIIKNTIGRKTHETTFIYDAGICHGSSGVAMIYYKMYIETKEPEFLEASKFWIDQTLKLAIHKDGIAGFKTYYTNPQAYINDYSLLTGVSGIGLMLLSYLMEDEMDWCDIFLL